MSPSYSWTQPVCDDCWDVYHPDRPSPRRGVGEPEWCVHCAEETTSGIYIRIDPAEAFNPTLKEQVLMQPRSSTCSAGGSAPVTTTAAQTVELPPGVRHWTTTAIAETWEAWDALTSADGWEEREWDVEPHLGSPDGRHVQKEALIRGHRIVVFRPVGEREEAR